jgi:hypothetical protein
MPPVPVSDRIGQGRTDDRGARQNDDGEGWQLTPVMAGAAGTGREFPRALWAKRRQAFSQGDDIALQHAAAASARCPRRSRHQRLCTTLCHAHPWLARAANWTASAQAAAVIFASVGGVRMFCSMPLQRQVSTDTSLRASAGNCFRDLLVGATLGDLSRHPAAVRRAERDARIGIDRPGLGAVMSLVKPSHRTSGSAMGGTAWAWAR